MAPLRLVQPAAAEDLRLCAMRIATRYPGARVRMAMSDPDGDLAHSLSTSRGYEIADALVEVIWPARDNLDGIDWRVRVLADCVAELAEIRSLIAGRTAVLLDRRGPIFMLMTGTRVPGVSVPAFRDWWLNQHAPLVEQHCYPMESYEQLHAERDLSRALCQEIGIDYRPVDAADCVLLSNVDAFYSQISNPAVAGLLMDDERPFSDVTAGGFGMLGPVLLDSQFDAIGTD